jgi:hypothetical protein
MTDSNRSSQASDSNSNEDAPAPGTVMNSGKPIAISKLQLNGIAARSVRPEETMASVYIWLGLTSDDQRFHLIAPNLRSAIEGAASQDGKHIDISRPQMVLLVLHADGSADAWLDTAAVVTEVRIKRTIEPGTVVFENDIADITGLWFPAVSFQPSDKIIVLFQEGFRFALFFDFNPENALDISRAKRELGRLYRRLRHAELYDFIENDAALGSLIELGWFPFVELLPRDFGTLSKHVTAGLPLNDEENRILTAFTPDRLDRMVERWMGVPYFKERELLLKAAVDAFKASNPIATIKIILSEIEGLMSDAYFAAKGERTRRIIKLIEFCGNSTSELSGSRETLLLPDAFVRYLRDYTYADFNYEADERLAGSRHAVGHGAAAPSSYTMIKALQALLTLDQIGFYLRSR